MKAYTWISRRTKKARHNFCQMIAPTLYKEYLLSASIRRGVPRPMTLFLKEYMGDRALTGCEIGVARGLNAKNICQTLNIETLYLIDPYTNYVSKKMVENYIGDYPEAQKLLADFKHQIMWLFYLSTEALEFLPKKLDFVYIDGNHTYQHVKSDLRLYFERVKHGGVLGGHDFSGDFTGIVKAVIEFANEKELDLHGQAHDFWFIKP